MLMYDTYRAQALAELEQLAEIERQNIGSEYTSAIALGARPSAAYAAYVERMAQLDAQVGAQASAIDAEYDAKEAEHARIAAIPLRGGNAGQQLMPQSLSTPYQVAPPDNAETDEPGESLLSTLLGWLR